MKLEYEQIIDISRKVDIVNVISDYLPLTQKGRNYFAICPFHDDHNPSMSISPEKQIYRCFVCGASGNVFNFVKNYEKISYIEAVNKVALKAGIDLGIKNVTKVKTKNEKYDKYYKMYEVATKYYKNNIKSVYGKAAIKYLHDRNINDEIIDEFMIGLSLNDNGISKLLSKKGYKKEELIDIGLCGNKDNFVYDIFRGRIMFPLCDNDGNVVGFSGRIYEKKDESKYVNSKESLIFKKGLLLYNYHRALKYAREKRSIIVVEGFMDVIRLYTIGIKNVVATMGTAITKEHANLIKHLSKNVILCFDGDKAGEKATISAINELEKVGLDPKIIRLEEDLDPDDYIIKKGEELFQSHLKNLLSTMDFKLELNKKNTNFKDFNEVSNYLKEVAKELEKIDDKVVFELTVKKISKETGVDVNTIESLVGQKPKEEIKIIDSYNYNIKNKYEKAEQYLIYYMLRCDDAIKAYENNISYLPNEKLSKIANKILAFYYENKYINVTDFIVYLNEDEDLINEVLKIDGLKLPSKPSENGITDFINMIEEGLIESEIKKLKNEIAKESNVAKKIDLLKKLTELKKRSACNERN